MLSWLALIPVIIGYAVVVRSLRYRRINQLQRQYGSTPEQFKAINYRDAQAIVAQLGLYECPWTFLTGKDFAFLRVSTPTCSPLSAIDNMNLP